MEVILLEKVRNLGGLGDQVKVKAGFGRNYLIPQHKAVSATPDNVKKFETRRAELEKVAQEKLSAAQARADGFAAVVLTIPANASEEGKLYGSIGPLDIVKTLSDAGHAVEKQEVIMSEGVIRATGTFEIVLQLHTDVTAKIQVVVEAA